MEHEIVPERPRRVKPVGLVEVLERVPMLARLLSNAHARGFVWLLNASRPRGGYMWWGVESIAEQLHVSRSTALRMMKRLRAIGLVSGERTLQHGEALPHGKRVARTVVLRRIVVDAEEIQRVAVGYAQRQIGAAIARAADLLGRQQSVAGLLNVKSGVVGVSLYGHCYPWGVSKCDGEGCQMTPDLKEDLRSRNPSSSGSPARSERATGVDERPQIGAPDGADVRNASAVAAAGGEKTDFAPSGASTVTRGARAAGRERTDAPLVGVAGAGGAVRVASRAEREDGARAGVSRPDREPKRRGVAIGVLRYHRDTLLGLESKYRFTYAIEIVLARLREGFAASDLRAAVDGAKASRHNGGNPARSTVRMVFGTAERVQALAALAPNRATPARAGGQSGVSDVGRGGGAPSGVGAMDIAKSEATLPDARCKNLDKRQKLVDQAPPPSGEDYLRAIEELERLSRNSGFHSRIAS